MAGSQLRLLGLLLPLLLAACPRRGDNSWREIEFETETKRESFADYTKGKPALLNVWASWCGPCREELPLLERTSHGDVLVIGANIDAPRLQPKAKRILEELHITYPQIFDPSGIQLGKMVGEGLPLTILFNSDGLEVWRREGMIGDPDPDFERALALVRRQK